MDDNYPTLKRPKKKLIFPTTQGGVLNQWTHDIVTLEDVDKIFDDLDSKVEDLPSPSPEIHIPNKNKHVERDVTPFLPPEELLKCQMISNGDHEHQHSTPASLELDIGSETPFKAHKPVKTSSPIEGNAIRENKQKSKGDSSASPILFDCEDRNEDLETTESPPEKPQNNNKRNESDDSLFETLPKKPALEKLSAQKKKTAPKRSKPSRPPVSPVRKNELKATSAPEKLTEYVKVSTKMKHDMTSFLQKLRDAGQPKLGLAGMSQPKAVYSVPEPEPEDDFVILEDVPFHVSIPSKHSKSLKEKQTKTSSSDTEAKDTAGEEHSADKHQDIEQDHRQQDGSTSVEKNIRKTRNQGSGPNSATSDQDHPVLATTESDNAENILKQGKTKKKKTLSKNDNKSEDPDTERDDGIPAKKIVKKKKTVKNDKEDTRRKTKREIKKAKTLSDRVEPQNQELNSEHQLHNDGPVSGANNVETEPKGQNMPSSQEKTSDEDIVLRKRKRKLPGEGWVSFPQNSEQQATEKQPTVRKTKQANKESSSAPTSTKAAPAGRKKNLKPSSTSSDGQRKKAEKKVKRVKPKSKRPVIAASSDESNEVFGYPIQDIALDRDSDSDSSPLQFPHRERSISSGEKAFHKVYQNSANEKKASPPDHASPTRPEGVLDSRESVKRIRKSPGNWWQVNPTVEEQDVTSPQPQRQKPKKGNAIREKKQAENPTVRSRSKPLEGAPKQKKRSLATMRDLGSPVVAKSRVRKENTALANKKNVSTPPGEDIEVDHNIVSIQMDELQGTFDQSPTQDTTQESTSKVIRSGPSSMIGLENYDEDEDLVLPSTTVKPVLCSSDLCCAPLRPLILQSKDKLNLLDWLKTIWLSVDRHHDITPDHFEWYCYRSRAMGILVDLHTGSICNGKILLGSFMKKPLWVDHSATTVFNLLTSSVNVVLDCNKSNYNAGQSFMVPPGHAYSIQNLNAQPAMLCFTRFLTHESDD